MTCGNENPKWGSSSSVVGMASLPQPKRLYQAWKGRNVSLSFSHFEFSFNFFFFKNPVEIKVMGICIFSISI